MVEEKRGRRKEMLSRLNLHFYSISTKLVFVCVLEQIIIGA